MRTSLVIAIVLVMSWAGMVMAQGEPCDLNENGYVDVADCTHLLSILGGWISIDSLPEYVPAWDCDQDSMHLTVSDIYSLYGRLVHGFGWGRGLHIVSDVDTIWIPDAVAGPGDEIRLPVYIGTERSLYGAEFYVSYDESVLDVVGVLPSDSMPGFAIFSRLFEGGASAAFIRQIPLHVPLAFLDLIVHPDVPVPTETHIQFGDNPHRAVYTGLCEPDTLAVPPAPVVYFISPVKIGSTITIPEVSVSEDQPKEQGHLGVRISPDPFNAATVVEFTVDRDANVKISIYDILGCRVATLFDQPVSPGVHSVTWNAAGLSSGKYFCLVTDGVDRASRPVTLLK